MPAVQNWVWCRAKGACMSTTAVALAGYAFWNLLLLIVIVSLRTVLTLSGARAANRFAVDGADVSPFSSRLCRAHANTYEHLPIFAGLVGAAYMSDALHITDGLALWVLAARIGQSSVHLLSVRARAVIVRFTFLLVQIGIEVWWAAQLLRLAVA